MIFLIIFVFKIFRVVDSFWLNLIVELLFIVLLFDWFELGIIIRRMDILKKKIIFIKNWYLNLRI